MKCNIDDLTLGQLKEIAAMVGSSAAPATPATPHPALGKYAVVRCSQAGVHAGLVHSVNSDHVELDLSRRLWRWAAKEGVSLTALAETGCDESRCNFSPILQTPLFLTLSDGCEIILCGPKSAKMIQEVKHASQ